MDTKTARDMIRQEADFLEVQHKEKWPHHEARESDVDYKRGKIDGLRQAERLMSEGE